MPIITISCAPCIRMPLSRVSSATGLQPSLTMPIAWGWTDPLTPFQKGARPRGEPFRDVGHGRQETVARFLFEAVIDPEVLPTSACRGTAKVGRESGRGRAGEGGRPVGGLAFSGWLHPGPLPLRRCLLPAPVPSVSTVDGHPSASQG